MKQPLIKIVLFIFFTLCYQQAAAQRGTLKIVTSPGDAKIYINDKRKGNSPQEQGLTFEIKLAEGEYVVSAKKDDGGDYEYVGVKNDVFVSEDSLQTIKITLTKRLTEAGKIHREEQEAKETQEEYERARLERLAEYARKEQQDRDAQEEERNEKERQEKQRTVAKNPQKALEFNQEKHSVYDFVSRTLVGATTDGGIWSVYLERETDDAYFTYVSGKTQTAKYRIIDDDDICFDFNNDDGIITGVCKTISSAGRGYHWLTEGRNKASSQIIFTLEGKVGAAKKNQLNEYNRYWKGGLIVGRTLKDKEVWYARLAENGEFTFVFGSGRKKLGRYEIDNHKICITLVNLPRGCRVPTEKDDKLLWLSEEDGGYSSEILYVIGSQNKPQQKAEALNPIYRSNTTKTSPR